MRERNRRRDLEQPPVASTLPFIVRRMQEQDIPDVMEIERRSFPSPWPESAYRYELLYRSDSRFYVLRPAGEPPPATGWRDRLWSALRRGEGPPLLGYIGLRLYRDTAHISTFAIHPDWRGRGLGEFLLLAALEKALDNGVRRVTLEVRASNRVAQQLYIKVGFVRTGIRPAYYRDGEDAWLMMLGPLDEARVARLRELRQEVEGRLAKAAAGNGRE